MFLIYQHHKYEVNSHILTSTNFTRHAYIWLKDFNSALYLSIRTFKLIYRQVWITNITINYMSPMKSLIKRIEKKITVVRTTQISNQ